MNLFNYKPLQFPALLLCCVTLCSTTIQCRRKTTNTQVAKGEVQEPQTEKTVAIPDTVEPVFIPDKVAGQNPISTIEGFYKNYIKADFLPERRSNDLLKKKYLTKGLIEKLRRVGTAMDADPIIRAQDVNEHMLETIKAKHLEGNWYMVEFDWYPSGDKAYDWNVSGDKGHQEIPLRVTRADGHYMIDYITPYWNGSSYGDSLLLNTLPKQPIDSSSPMSLLKTFYAAYVSEYCSMPEGLVPRLEALRNAHLTPNALAQFEQSANEYKLDSEFNYDLLIDYFDFDCVWIPSMTYEQIDQNTYQMRYTKFSDAVTAVSLGVVKHGGEYKIDKIKIER